MSITRWKIETLADLRFATKGVADTTPVKWTLPDEMEDWEVAKLLGAVVLDLVAEIHFAERPENAHFINIGPARPSTWEEPQA